MTDILPTVLIRPGQDGEPDIERLSRPLAEADARLIARKWIMRGCSFGRSLTPVGLAWAITL